MQEKTNSTARALRIIKLLKGRSLTGLSNKEIAEALNENAVNISRATNILIDEGLVTKLDNGRFALGIQLLQIATAHANECNAAIDRVQQLNQRIAAGAMN